jgi:hypothetical protein
MGKYNFNTDYVWAIGTGETARVQTKHKRNA